jgi:hypothetical protein
MDNVNYEADPVLEGLTEQQLKDLIVHNVKQITVLKEDAKAYAKGAREAIKALNERNVEALEILQVRAVDAA